MEQSTVQPPNIVQLLMQVDDSILVKVLLEMEPIQMTIFGAQTCWQFHRLTSDRKVWRQVIERQGLTEALLKRRGGKANLKRIEVMRKTYKSYLLEKENEIKRQEEFLPRLASAAWSQLVYQFNTLYKDQNTCRHKTITYAKEYLKIKCPSCSTFAMPVNILATGGWWNRFDKIQEYLEFTNQQDAEQFSITNTFL